MFQVSQGSAELRMSYHERLAQMLLAFKEITLGGLLQVNLTSDAKVISPGAESPLILLPLKEIRGHP